MKTDTLIVGAGLSGLRLADMLTQAGQDFQIIDRRDRTGGRVLSQKVDTGAYDLGPAWFWDGQPRIADLIRRYDLSVFEQYAQGDFRYEDAQGRLQQGRGAGSMQGSFRLEGGLGQLCDALTREISVDRLHLNNTLLSCAQISGGIETTTAEGTKFTARRVVFALPPRLVGEITFDPPLSPEVTQCLRDIPTWMAGQAKAIALYDQPFWRAAGLSGDAMSHVGPMVEIHDACPARGAPFALFGFIGVPPGQRGDSAALKAAVHAQLVRLFGSAAAEPVDILLKDWAQDSATATSKDAEPLYAHPRYGMPPALAGLWDDRLMFAGSEMGTDFGGYLEGALEAAEAAFAAISAT